MQYHTCLKLALSREYWLHVLDRVVDRVDTCQYVKAPRHGFTKGHQLHVSVSSSPPSSGLHDHVPSHLGEFEESSTSCVNTWQILAIFPVHLPQYLPPPFTLVPIGFPPTHSASSIFTPPAMDGFNDLQPPEAYEQVQWIADIFVALMGVGWIVNYGSMLSHAYTDSTYSMALLPLCSNIGWELTFVLVHPSPNPYEFWVFASLLTLNLGIMVSAARVAPKEWTHSPLVARNSALIFLAGIIFCFAGHVSLAAQIGPALAYSWGAFICQLSLSVGALCQLLQRNSTRGTSWAMWYAYSTSYPAPFSPLFPRSSLFLTVALPSSHAEQLGRTWMTEGRKHAGWAGSLAPAAPSYSLHCGGSSGPRLSRGWEAP